MSETSTFTVQRSEVVHAEPERVYEQLVDFRRWQAWSPWEEVDPDLKRTYSGPESGVGSVYNWSGNRKAGEGRMEITNAEEPFTVVVDLQFLKPIKATNTTTFTIVPEEAGSRVTWTMTGQKTLATKVMGIFKSMDKFVGPDFEKGLAKLKATAERSA